MAVVSMKQLLEAGVHFGHQTRRWNPKMAKYIFGERNGIYIINLQKTANKIKDAFRFIRSVAAEGEYVLFVGTKKQAQASILDEATKCNMFFINKRSSDGDCTGAGLDKFRSGLKIYAAGRQNLYLRQGAF